MGVDIQTYRAKIGTFKHSCGVDVLTLVLVVNFNHGLKAVGSVLFIGILLMMAGIESNPGPIESEYTDQSDFMESTKIKVTGFPESISKELMEIFFEHQTGSEIKEVTIDKEGQFAIIEFQHANAVEAIMKKLPLCISGSTLSVEIYAGKSSAISANPAQSEQQLTRPIALQPTQQSARTTASQGRPAPQPHGTLPKQPTETFVYHKHPVHLSPGTSNSLEKTLQQLHGTSTSHEKPKQQSSETSTAQEQQVSQPTQTDNGQEQPVQHPTGSGTGQEQQEQPPTGACTGQEQQIQQPSGYGNGQEQPTQPVTGTCNSQEQPVLQPTRTCTGQKQPIHQQVGFGIDQAQPVQQPTVAYTKQEQSVQQAAESSVCQELPVQQPSGACTSQEQPVEQQLTGTDHDQIVQKPTGPDAGEQQKNSSETKTKLLFSRESTTDGNVQGDNTSQTEKNSVPERVSFFNKFFEEPSSKRHSFERKHSEKKAEGKGGNTLIKKQVPAQMNSVTEDVSGNINMKDQPKGADSVPGKRITSKRAPVPAKKPKRPVSSNPFQIEHFAAIKTPNEAKVERHRDTTCEKRRKGISLTTFHIHSTKNTDRWSE